MSRPRWLSSRVPSRRAVLRGVGASLALPALESLASGSPWAQDTEAELPSERDAGASPKRLVYVYVPNGVHLPDWRPSEPGALPSELPATLDILARHRSSMRVLSGLTLDKARPNGDGPGDHARAAGAFLTASQPLKADGTALRVGISADQVAARAVGGRTRLRSLQLGCEPGRQSGQCDSGYPCAYSSNLSWSTPHTPMLHETNPAFLFDRLFGTGREGLSEREWTRRNALRKSVLDLVSRDAHKLSRELGRDDRRKLEEYLDAVRELERRVSHAAETVNPARERPAGTPADFGEHASLLFELLALALATDTTRIATFLLTNEGSNRTYPSLDIKEGHHTLSHHGGDPAKEEQLARINRMHLGLLGGFLDRLVELSSEADSLLENTWIVYGSGIADGNVHDHHDLPILLLGGRGLAAEEHVAFPADTPLANLHVRLLEELGVPATELGDATGTLALG